MVTALAALAALVQDPTAPPPPIVDSQTWHLRVARVVPTTFLLSLPEDYAKDKNKRWPLLLFLHGSGERGSDISKVKRHGPPKEIAEGRKLPFIVLSPQCPDNADWDIDILTQLIDMAERRYRVDKDREYVTGLSLGGYATYALAAANPGRFAAIAPISGGGDMIIAWGVGKTPAYLVHGDADTTVPIEEDRRMAAYLKDMGDEVKYVEVKGGGHDVWTDVYGGTELYDWLLSHSLRR